MIKKLCPFFSKEASFHSTFSIQPSILSESFKRPSSDYFSEDSGYLPFFVLRWNNVFGIILSFLSNTIKSSGVFYALFKIVAS